MEADWVIRVLSNRDAAEWESWQGRTFRRTLAECEDELRHIAIETTLPTVTYEMFNMRTGERIEWPRKD
jgi:hypothetical protein